MGSILANAGAIIVIYLIVIVVVIASWWKLFTKAGKPGWAAIIPIYNLIVLCEICGRPAWWVILILLVPCANIIFLILLYIDLAKSFGKDAVFAVGLILLGIVFLPILAFGDSKYVGPAAAK
jgi:hypothetical protein